MFKKILLVIVVMIALTGCYKKSKNKVIKAKYNIVTSNYVSYDFVRAIIGDNRDISVKLLLKPGSDPHIYEPSSDDIVSIKESSLFIYTGGDSGVWVDKLLKEKKKDQSIKLTDLVKLSEEEKKEGIQEEDHDHTHQEEKEYDEHVWTSPVNAKIIISKLSEKISALDASKKADFSKNAQKYIRKIDSIDKEIRSVVKNAKTKTIVVADRFPFLYFVKEYGLDYRAAFADCAEDTEASTKTLSYLVDYVKRNKISYILKIELSTGKTAKAISDETGAKVRVLNSAHNITADDFEKGVTYVDIMKENIKVLRTVLNA